MALLLLCCVAIVTFLPATVQEQYSMDPWLMMDAANQNSPPRRITPKSIFIAPSFSHASLPACAEGYRPDSMGRCVKVVRVNQAAQLDFLLRRLNALYAPPPIPPSPTDSSGPLQVSLPIGAVPSTDIQGSGSSQEVAVVLADVVKSNVTGPDDAPQTMLAVWNISNNTTAVDGAPSEPDASPKRNTTEFLSSLSLPKVEETIPIVMQTPPSTLVIQDLPGSDMVSRPLSSEVDFDIPYDYYQDEDSTERCSEPPCKDSLAEINSRSPHIPDSSSFTSSETQSENVTEYNVTEPPLFSVNSDGSESDTYLNDSSTEFTLKDNDTDIVVEQESEAFPKENITVANDTDDGTVDSVNSTAVSSNMPNARYPEDQEIYAGSFETSVEVSVRPSAERRNETDEIFDYSTETVGVANTSDLPVSETLPEVDETDSDENTPKKPMALPEESLLVGTSMDPLSDANSARSEEELSGVLDMTEQRSPSPEDHGVSSTPSIIRFPPDDEGTVAKTGRVRFPDTSEEPHHAVPQETPAFWWLPSGWKLDQSRHHPVLLRFWRKMPEAHYSEIGRHHHTGQFYQTYADG